MTGLQALQRVASTKPTRPGQIERIEFEYRRHGTLCLTGSFDTCSGQVIRQTIGTTHKTEDFVAHLQNTVALDPAAPWVFVMDNYNTHSTIPLVRWINETCRLNEDLGVERRRGILHSKRSRQAFLSDPSHRIRIQYLPKHTSWLNQIEIWFGILSRRVLKRGNFTSIDDLATKISRFIDYFNQTLAKPFKWTYTGRPLNI